MALPNSAQAFELPKVRTILKVGSESPHSEDNLFWDVKFFPFETAEDSDPVFALVNQTNVLICRMTGDEENGVSILHTLATEGKNDSDSPSQLNSCCWSYIDQSEPLLVAAGDAGLLQVFDVLNGKLFTTLIGHGRGTINDLSTHPIYPWIVASASMDSSVRIWDLRRWDHRHESPCVIICGHGNGHKEGILTVSWHSHGRFLVTGGHDHRICVWTVPDLAPESTFWEEISPSQRERSAGEIRIIHYPHFISSAVHSNYVDCARFYGDDIISKAAEEYKAVLWRITGFSSRNRPPDTTTAPKTEEHLETRNGFARLTSTTTTTTHNGIITANTNDKGEAYKSQPPYQRLLEFDAPNCKSFYMRFGFLSSSTSHPELHTVLAMGNNASQVFFWDLNRLELGHDGGLKDHDETFRVPARRRRGVARPVDRLGRLASSTGQNTRDYTGTASSPASSRRSSSVGTFDQMSVSNNAPSISTPAPGFGAGQSSQRSSLPPPPPPPQHQHHPNPGLTSDILATIEAPQQHQQIPPMIASRPGSGSEPDRTLYPLNQPHRPLKAHSTATLTDFSPRYTPFTARAADWSPCGRWCVVAGQASEQQVGIGVGVVFGRW